MTKRTTRGLLALAILVCSAGVGIRPAAAANPYWVFWKNWSYQWNSTFQYYAGDGTPGGAYRTGSGHQTNECLTSAASNNHGGWLPNGYYAMGTWANDWNGSVVKGRATYLGNRFCFNNSAQRTELMVHSWSPFAVGNPWTPSGSYSASPGGGDYRSQACIKLQSNGPYGSPYMTGDIADVQYYSVATNAMSVTVAG